MRGECLALMGPCCAASLSLQAPESCPRAAGARSSACRQPAPHPSRPTPPSPTARTGTAAART
eukprot:483729-Prymnesium_polylepis.1